MDVENYTQDLSQWMGVSQRFMLKPAPGKLSMRAVRRLLQAARQEMEGFGIDFSQYHPPTAVFQDMLVADVIWVHRESQCELKLTGIYFDERTGEILQCGTQYGALVR